MRAADGIPVTVDHLGGRSIPAVSAYRTLLDRLSDAGLASGADIMIRPETLDDLPGDARRICLTAAHAGATVTLAPAADVDAALALVTALRQDFRSTGPTSAASRCCSAVRATR
ncbi:hypothetical protein ACFQ3F_09560 [Nocardioides ginsengisoli]|uniref:Uncharacterized protein n=1 Tax=Nocardioides ginsengisoli TaxID=363868 RepID=A0ABW3VYX9_9ACTN